MGKNIATIVYNSNFNESGQLLRRKRHTFMKPFYEINEKISFGVLRSRAHSCSYMYMHADPS